MNLSNIKIGPRLALGYGIICALLVVIVGLAITMLGKINAGTNDIANDRLPKIEASSALQIDINEMAIALRNMLIMDSPTDRQSQLHAIMESRKDSAALLQQLKDTLRRQDAIEVLEVMLESHDKYLKGQDAYIAMINAGATDDAKAYLINNLRPILVIYTDALQEQIKLQRDITKGSADDAARTYAETRTLMIVLGAVALALAGLVGFWISKTITGPVSHALQVANTVASGDLTSRIEVTTSDEMGQLLRALKAMNTSLANTVATVRTGTEAIGSASAQVASGNMDLSSRTEQQASSLEETASSMEELTSTVKQNADNARQANMLAANASEVAVRGGEVIGKVVGTMGEINTSASKIVDIIGVIDGIAFQTNILALNAAVEAARAGEQGRGFAVVASEVRTLAQRSASAAKEIKSLIDDSVHKVKAGTELVNHAGVTMNEIVDSVKRVTDIMAEISAASQEQTSGIEQINQAITQMDQVTQQNASLVEEAAAASESMQQQAAALSQAVSVFKVSGEQFAVRKEPTLVSAAVVPARPASVRPPVGATARGNAVPTEIKSPRRPLPAATGSDWTEF